MRLYAAGAVLFCLGVLCERAAPQDNGTSEEQGVLGDTIVVWG